jgi:predicted nucleotidyltransferase
MLDTATAIEMSVQYAREVAKILNPNAVILFGSHTKGTAKINSDIDIAVIFDNFSGDYIETLKQLYKIRRNISTYIEPVLLDISNDKCGFVEYILKTGVLVYKSQDFNLKNYL